MGKKIRVDQLNARVRFKRGAQKEADGFVRQLCPTSLAVLDVLSTKDGIGIKELSSITAKEYSTVKRAVRKLKIHHYIYGVGGKNFIEKWTPSIDFVG